jgi:hypothetical protein
MPKCDTCSVLLIECRYPVVREKNPQWDCSTEIIIRSDVLGGIRVTLGLVRSLASISLLITTACEFQPISIGALSPGEVLVLDESSIVNDLDSADFRGSCGGSEIEVSGTDSTTIACLDGRFSYTTTPQDSDGVRAYLFRERLSGARADGSWTRWTRPIRIESPEGSSASAGFGDAIAIDGGVVVIGAPLVAAGGRERGAVYLFKRRGLEWVQSTSLLGTQDDGHFGEDVDVDGDALIVGAQKFGFPGTVFFYRETSDAWQEEPAESMVLAAEALFANRVGIAGNRAFVTAHALDLGTEPSAGSLFSYRYVGDQWVIHEQLVAPEPSAGMRFGHRAALVREHLFVGSVSGGAFVFDETAAG